MNRAGSLQREGKDTENVSAACPIPGTKPWDGGLSPQPTPVCPIEVLGLCSGVSPCAASTRSTCSPKGAASCFRSSSCRPPGCSAPGAHPTGDLPTYLPAPPELKSSSKPILTAALVPGGLPLCFACWFFWVAEQAGDKTEKAGATSEGEGRHCHPS